MGRYGFSPLRHMAYQDHLPHIGNKNTKYTIVLPNNTSMVAWWSVDLLALPIYYSNVECVVDHEKIVQRIPEKSKIHPWSYFLVNDSLFLMKTHDQMMVDWERWVPYESKFCTAFLVLTLRHSTNFIFKDCPIPVFPLPNKIFYYVDPSHLEGGHALGKEKDIDVFFAGRAAIRIARNSSGQKIRDTFPNSHIQFICEGEAVSSQTYADLMSRSKIAWCPRSCWSPPDRECNFPTGREYEAMCSESMIIKHSIGSPEPEERIPGIHFVEFKNDDTDLIEKIQYYLEHDEERTTIARNGRLWWERNGSVRGRSSLMLKYCLQSMGEIDPIFDPI